MNTFAIILTCVAAGPFSAAINQVDGTTQWQTQTVGNVSLDLPLPEAIETEEYKRTAPDNYKIPTEHWTKTVPAWCPAWPQRLHGYNCGMVRSVEDLAGHLQSAHGVPLETLNAMGRDKWQSYHEDLHWCEESEARQEQFLHPQPAKASGCASGNCPTGKCPTQSYRTRGFF